MHREIKALVSCLLTTFKQTIMSFASPSDNVSGKATYRVDTFLG